MLIATSDDQLPINYQILPWFINKSKEKPRRIVEINRERAEEIQGKQNIRKKGGLNSEYISIRKLSFIYVLRPRIITKGYALD